MLTPAETVEIFKKHPDKQVSAGTIIFKQGDVGDEMFGIISGEVELSMNGKVIETIQAGDVFGEGALMQGDRETLGLEKSVATNLTPESTALFSTADYQSCTSEFFRLRRCLIHVLGALVQQKPPVVGLSQSA